MTDLSAFLPQVSPWVSGCPDPVAEAQVRLSIAEFCRRTHVWRQELTMSITSGEPRYDPVSVCNRQFVAVKGASVSGQDINPFIPEEMDARHSSWRSQSGTVSGYYLEGPSIVRLYRIPDAAVANGLVIRAAVAPKATDTDVDDFIFEQYNEDIAHGAIARIMSMKGKPWTDKQDALKYQGYFQSAVDRAIGDVRKSHTHADRKVQMRRFF